MHSHCFVTAFRPPLLWMLPFSISFSRAAPPCASRQRLSVPVHRARSRLSFFAFRWTRTYVSHRLMHFLLKILKKRLSASPHCTRSTLQATKTRRPPLCCPMIIIYTPFCTCRLILVYLLFTDDPRAESTQCTTHTWHHSSTFQLQPALSRSRFSIDSPTGMSRPPAHPMTPTNCVTACFWPTSAHASFYISRKRRGHFSAFPFLMHRTTTSCKSLHRSSTQAIIDKYELRPHCKSSSGRRHSLCTSCHWPRDCPCDRPRERH